MEGRLSPMRRSRRTPHAEQPGAYVLYPGAQNQNWQGFHEIIPGLGAFAIRPSYDEDEGTSAGM